MRVGHIVLQCASKAESYRNNCTDGTGYERAECVGSGRLGQVGRGWHRCGRAVCERRRWLRVGRARAARVVRVRKARGRGVGGARGVRLARLAWARVARVWRSELGQGTGWAARGRCEQVMRAGCGCGRRGCGLARAAGQVARLRRTGTPLASPFALLFK